MDLLKKASARAQQTIGEVVGQASKTELDAGESSSLNSTQHHSETTACLYRVEEIRLHTEKVLSSLKHYVQPDIAADLVKMMEGGKKSSTTADTVAHTTQDLSNKLLETNCKTAGASVGSMSVAYLEIGKQQQELQTMVKQEAFDKLRNLLDTDMKNVKLAKDSLHTKRLDLDTVKNKKAPVAGEVDRLTAAFNQQQATVRELAQTVESRVESDLKTFLKAFVDAEMHYHQACAEQLAKIN